MFLDSWLGCVCTQAVQRTLWSLIRQPHSRPVTVQTVPLVYPAHWHMALKEHGCPMWPMQSATEQNHSYHSVWGLVRFCAGCWMWRLCMVSSCSPVTATLSIGFVLEPGNASCQKICQVFQAKEFGFINRKKQGKKTQKEKKKIGHFKIIFLIRLEKGDRTIEN